MAFFRTINFTEPLPNIVGDVVTLRTPQMTDYDEWAALREASRDFLTPWEPTWPSDDLTRSAFRRRIKRYSEDLRADQGYAFLITRNSDHALVGGLTARQSPPQRRPGRRSRLLDQVCRMFLAATLDRRPSARRDPLCPAQRAAAASDRGGLHSDQHRLHAASGKKRLRRARRLCAREYLPSRHQQDHRLYARLQDAPKP